MSHFFYTYSVIYFFGENCMLIDLAQEYEPEKKQFLRDLREKIILHLAASNDHKKIFSFLNKVGIIDIDEKEKTVYV